jgi:sRNA-binding regulator protein Hfq
MANRKLIRPNLAEIKEKMTARNAAAPAREHREHRENHESPAPRRRTVPPEQTSAEAFYYLKQMNGRTPMVVVLDDGEQLRGHIEWYDRSCIKVHRDDAPNIFVYKHCIKYLYKQEEEQQRPEAVVAAE